MLSKVVKQLENSKRIVFFTGAGISTESNIPDFRSSNGLYNHEKIDDLTPEYLLSYNCFKNSSKLFYNYYFSNMIHIDKFPNSAHNSITSLSNLGYEVIVITQNIDGLHSLAGNKNIIELHGSVYKNYCINCGREFSINEILYKKPIPYCNYCNEIIRPNVILYGEALDKKVIDKAINAIKLADMLFVIGTSLVVNPAASLLQYYKGNQFVLINKSSTPYDNQATYRFYESCGKIMSEIIKRLGLNHGK
ncbi:MAG: NAD-dependent protein deacylase [Clostridiales bacterium]|nr:NAD-dependent protein deacylase [Clostridiales bacterium]